MLKPDSHLKRRCCAWHRFDCSRAVQASRGSLPSSFETPAECACDGAKYLSPPSGASGSALFAADCACNKCQLALAQLQQGQQQISLLEGRLQSLQLEKDQALQEIEQSRRNLTRAHADMSASYQKRHQEFLAAHQDLMLKQKIQVIQAVQQT